MPIRNDLTFSLYFLALLALVGCANSSTAIISEIKPLFSDDRDPDHTLNALGGIIRTLDISNLRAVENVIGAPLQPTRELSWQGVGTQYKAVDPTSIAARAFIRYTAWRYRTDQSLPRYRLEFPLPARILCIDPTIAHQYYENSGFRIRMIPSSGGGMGMQIDLDHSERTARILTLGFSAIRPLNSQNCIFDFVIDQNS